MLQTRIKPIFEAFYQQAEAERNYNDFITQLKGVYRDIFGKDEAGRNDVSLVTCTGPIKKRLEFVHYVCRNHCHYPPTREGRGPHQGREETAADGHISLLYTGDLNFKRSVTAAVKTFLGDDRWQRIRFLQVPHHGSHKSWEAGPGQTHLNSPKSR